MLLKYEEGGNFHTTAMSDVTETASLQTQPEVATGKLYGSVNCRILGLY